MENAPLPKPDHVPASIAVLVTAPIGEPPAKASSSRYELGQWAIPWRLTRTPLSNDIIDPGVTHSATEWSLALERWLAIRERLVITLDVALDMLFDEHQDWWSVLFMTCAGMLRCDIAAKLGIHEQTVYYRLRKARAFLEATVNDDESAEVLRLYE